MIILLPFFGYVCFIARCKVYNQQCDTESCCLVFIIAALLVIPKCIANKSDFNANQDIHDIV